MIEKQTGPLPYPPVEIAEIAALRAEVAELREQVGAIRHRRQSAGLAATVIAATPEEGPAREAVADLVTLAPAKSIAEDHGSDLLAAVAEKIVADLQSFGNSVDERQQLEQATDLSQIATA